MGGEREEVDDEAGEEDPEPHLPAMLKKDKDGFTAGWAGLLEFEVNADVSSERFEDDVLGVIAGETAGEGVTDGVQEKGVIEGVVWLSRPFGNTVLYNLLNFPCAEFMA